jgi:hypothetical protein
MLPAEFSVEGNLLDSPEIEGNLLREQGMLAAEC